MSVLSRFVEARFVPDCLAGLNGNQGYCAAKAVRWLGQVLRRQATIEDLTTANIARVTRRLAREGYVKSQVKQYRNMLTRIARYAFRLGLLDKLPETPPLPTARKKQRRQPSPAKGTLAHTFATELIPQHLPDSSQKRLNDFHAAIAQFGRWLGHDATLDDVNEQSAKDFVAAQVAAGRQARAAEIMGCKLWQVCRWIDAERFPDRRFNEPVTPAEEGTLRHLFETVYYPQRLIGKSRARYYEYQSACTRFNRYAGHEVRLDELNDGLFAGFICSLLEAGVKPVTVNGYRARINALWNLAVDLGKVDRPSRLKKIPEALDAPDAWSEEELQRIFAAPLRIHWESQLGGIDTGKWLRALLLTCYWTALRRGTLLKLRWADVNLTDGWLNVPGAIMKAGRGKRLRLGSDAIAALREIAPGRSQDQPLFPFPINTTTLSKYLRRVLAEAEIPPSNRSGLNQLHKMRRSVATITAERRGLAAASELLGHSGVEVTRRYIDPSKMPGSDFTEVLPMLTGVAASPTTAEPTPNAAEVDRSKWTVAQFAADALQLAETGDLLRASLSARIALERWLIALCPRRPRGDLPETGSRLRWLVEREKLTAEQAAQYRRAKKIASRAVHRGYIKPAQCEVLLAAVRELIGSDPAGGTILVSA